MGPPYRLVKTAAGTRLLWQRRLVRLGREQGYRYGPVWDTIVTLDRVWAANLAIELDHWLAGTDSLPTVE